MTIRTLTLSPGFDHVVRVDGLRAGEVGEVLSWRTDAAGKGVNVARTAATFGVECVAYSLVGAADQVRFDSLIRASGVEPITVPVDGPTRNNLTLTVADRPGIASHNVGPRIAASDHEAQALVDSLIAGIADGDVVVLSGAVPEPLPQDLYAVVARRAHECGARVIVDSQRGALTAAVETGLLHAAIPNLSEAAAAYGTGPEGVPLRALRAMKAAGVAEPLVTLGERGAARYDTVDPHDPQRVWCTVDSPVVVVGAGDAFVAGYCVGLSDPRFAALDSVSLALGTACAHVGGAEGAVIPRIATAHAALVEHGSLNED
ncbi:fructose 1-phosphate kinase [Gordonia araii NBRC 100433]|uniref:Fructose 1-phosphate kinase n=1 Tax=Gordonia araii NBRC 100433 TaxID=1073574 RepID=G7GXG9_9ACTN|nr:PfkB family carbohydrate kinase [Gordonia araii]NNG95920.1 hypothetical protein [Gordonia araii NBRC 100433]GAB08294.1 fructose 1-phosphate kinase [Gordonia araii NBRC 100433]